MTIRSHRDLKVWEKAVDLVIESCRLTKLLPKEAKRWLSKPNSKSNCFHPRKYCRGHGRDHLGDHIRHLSIADGSLMELETHLLVAERLSFLRANEIEPVLAVTAEVGRMLAGLTRSLKSLRPGS